MAEGPSLIPRIKVTLQKVGTIECDAVYVMDLRDATPGQRYYSTLPGYPYGECFEIANFDSTGHTWMLYLVGDVTCYPDDLPYPLLRVDEDTNVLGTYKMGNREGKVEVGPTSEELAD